MFGGEVEGFWRGTSLDVAAGESFSSRLPSPPLLLLLDMFIIRVPTFQLLKKTIDSSMLCFGASFDMITLSDADENRFYRELHPFITRCCCTYTSILHICLYPVILKKQSSGFLYFSCWKTLRLFKKQAHITRIPTFIWYDAIVRFSQKLILSIALCLYRRMRSQV